MDLVKMIGQLRNERDFLNEAIMILENLVTGQGTGRGRRRSLETRKKMAEAQRRRWATARKAKKS